MASQPDEDDEIIIVVGSRDPKPTAEVRLNINVGGTGGGPENPVFQFIRSLYQDLTDFDIDELFSPAHREMIKK